jgi:hypothetical protein
VRPAARPQGRGELPGERGLAGRLGADDGHAAGEAGAHGRGEVRPGRDRIGADRGRGDGDERAVRVEGDGAGPQAPAQLLAVDLGAEDGVHRLVGDRAHAGAEDVDVRGPDRLALEIHRVLVDDTVHGDVPLRVDLAHPRHATRQRDGLDRRGRDQDGQPIADRRRRADQVVVAGVGRVELADDEAMPCAVHGPSFHAGSNRGPEEPR